MRQLGRVPVKLGDIVEVTNPTGAMYMWGGRRGRVTTIFKNGLVYPIGVRIHHRSRPNLLFGGLYFSESELTIIERRP